MSANELLTLSGLMRSVYGRMMDEVCARHDLTMMELSILLFLANNPGHDTASELVSLRRMTKSHVSLAVHALARRGLLTREYRGGNRKTVHLTVLPAAQTIIADGQEAQKRFYLAITDGFSDAERETMRLNILRFIHNLQNLQ